MTRTRLVNCLAAIVAASTCCGFAEDAASARWLERFAFTKPPVEPSGVCTGRIGALPSFEVTPDAAGTRLVRVSLPFAPGALPTDLGLSVAYDRQGVATPCPTTCPDVRVLTLYPGKPPSVRRALVTFPFDFPNAQPVRFSLALSDQCAEPDKGLQPLVEKSADSSWQISLADVAVTIAPDAIMLTTSDKGLDKGLQPILWKAHLIAPQRTRPEPPVIEVVEWGQHYRWVRLLEPDAAWPRIIEVRIDSLGTVSVQAHVQRLGKGDASAPDLGWEIVAPPLATAGPHAFSDGEPCKLLTSDCKFAVDFPIAPFNRRGNVAIQPQSPGAQVRYLRCTADGQGVATPCQQSAWRSAAFVIRKAGQPKCSALLEPELSIRVSPEAFDAAYAMGMTPNLALWPALDELRRYTHDAIVQAMLSGDDFGNVTAFAEGQPAPVFGMNRLNHAPPMFAEAWRTGDRRLRDTAVLWCSNLYDLSIWWADADEFGGTRYNNANAAGSKEHLDDKAYMWRMNNAVHFCTKGYDSFLFAYEETGDPRMLTALNAQAAYARKYVHTDQGECRNIGDVADFMNLYRRTGVTMYRDEALRLFRELRTKLMPDSLFSQGGQPIVQDGPFIDDDDHGYKAPFAKPYIIGYALAGLPDLLREFPDEPRLRDVVRAVADFLVESQDPVGGWRYPHPRSARMLLDQAIEHAAQLSRAAGVLEARGEPIDRLLDAIERTLQARVNGFVRTGTILSGLQGWEFNPGNLKDGQTVYDLYKKPADRDPARDYAEGAVGIGGASPDGLAHFAEALDFYLGRRPAERLFHVNDALRAVLSRAPDRRIVLTPQEKGSYLRMARPDNPDIGFTLWAPEWATFPKLGYGPEELGGMTLDWKRDADSGAAWYTIDRKEATFTACFVPFTDYVACTYAVWPKPGVEVPAQFGVGPCQQMKAGVFESDDADLMNRTWFISDGHWVSVGSCANGNARNVQYVKGVDSPEMTGAMLEGGWKTIQSPRPDVPLLACVSRDGEWGAATAAESSTCICNNANASHRCMHSQGSTPLRKDGPTTLRVNAYLLRGSLDGLEQRYERDVARWKATTPSPGLGESGFQRYGVRADLPSFRDAQVARLTFPLAWRNAGLPFPAWREQARTAFFDALLPRPPLAPFAPHVIAVEDRGTYNARKLVLNISADNRIPAYLLVPKDRQGVATPCPAIIALHDHGAHFSIGKEKVIRPFGESKERTKDAEQWVAQSYGGKFIGDELAKRGYVVFSMDALYWGDRGRIEGVQYEAQQTLAANLLQLGTSWAGTILWDDLRSAEFVQGLPEVDPDRIGCVGLSMGSFRTWNLAAATDIIKAGAAICWMGDTPTLTSEGNNQTKGQSAFSMTHANLRNVLDYPDVASIACPKPMLFYNGEKDGLFPVPGVNACYEKLHQVWRDQGVDDRLVTKLWPVPHEFNAEMQAEAFAWLDKQLKP